MLEELQLQILNYLERKDVLNISKALNADSGIATEHDLMSRNEVRFLQGLDITSERYRGVIVTDDWFDHVDGEHWLLAASLQNLVRNKYNEGCSVVIVPTTGVFSVPCNLFKMFNFGSKSNFRAYTKMDIEKTAVGSRILGDSFPTEKVYTNVNFI